MTKTVLLKLLVTIIIMFILILPEYFQSPEGPIVALSCSDTCALNNSPPSLSSFNISFPRILQWGTGNQTVVLEIFINRSFWPTSALACQVAPRPSLTCPSCLLCDSSGPGGRAQALPSPAAVGSVSLEAKGDDLPSCEQYNVPVGPTREGPEDPRPHCRVEIWMGNAPFGRREPAQGSEGNPSCSGMGHLDSCRQISLQLQMGGSTLPGKITLYVLVLLVCMVLVIIVTYKVFQGNQKGCPRPRSAGYAAPEARRESDSAEQGELRGRTLSETDWQHETAFTPARDTLPPILELEAYPTGSPKTVSDSLRP
ncbi:transmembrane protein 156 [Tachyglossus aculeatus]|uniref:transmembrane protein 156 n=1 Tax=Tachyglossus aculeatus TaxID=9261 RepID=UPI0018F4170D|nr:transmembrane protein 156 [Tachyglossus aculeatus]